MKISVVMSVYNEEPKWLRESIESILNQTYTDFEFIIVLDNPENKALEKVIASYVNVDRRIVFLVNDRNLGLVGSLNKALSNCVGEYIARMDADDISYPERFERQLEYLQYNKLDLIGSNVKLFKNDKEYFYTTNKLTTHKYLKKLFSAGAIGIVHPTFFAKRSLFTALGGYKMALHAEDKEFLARVLFNGFKVGNIPDVLLDCRYNDKSITKTKAIYLYHTARYVDYVYKMSVRTGVYDFDDNFYENFDFSQREIDKFNKNRLLLSEARADLHNNKFFRFLIKILKLCFTSKDFINSFRVNVVIKWFSFLERID